MYICQICKKNPATIHLTDIHNNVKKEVHICEGCASEKGFNLQGAANLPQLLGLAAKKSVAAQLVQKQKAVEKELVCPQCGTTWTQFGERGRLGCPHDYAAFDSRLRPLVEGQIAAGGPDGNAFHIGKKPGVARSLDDREAHIRSLEKKLREAVAEENYETAAKCKAELDALRA